MVFYGMDTEQVLGESDALEQAARRLEEVMGGLHSSVQGAAWAGPDAESFREQWEATRRQGGSLVLPGLGDRSRELREHVQEQEQASAHEADGGWFEDTRDWLRDTGGDIVDAVGSGAQWAVDEVSELVDGLWEAGSDGSDWLGDRFSDATEWLGDRAEDGLDHVSTAVSAIRDLQWPRFTEVVVDGATGVVRGAGDVLELLTGIDLHLADDGSGYADPPVAVTPEESGLVPPSDLAQIIANTNATYGDAETGEVSMSVVGNPPTGVIVNIPGTEKWGPMAGDNPMDLTGNAAQAGSAGWSAGSEATADAIAQLYESGAVPPGTPLMLNGHSQGGMIAASLAANEDFASRYHVTTVMTYGSPVDNYDVPSGVNQLNIQHRGDAVPRIDAEGSAMGPVVPGPGGIPVPLPIPNPGELLANQNIGAGNTTTVTLDSPGSHPFDVGTNHSSGEYQDSVETALQDPTSPLSRYSQDPSLQPFLTGDPENVQHFTAGVHREH